jgi:hypothetical protein
MMSWLAQHREPALIAPSKSITDTSTKPVKAATPKKATQEPAADSCIDDYPCFSPAGYAIDTVLPLINIHQADYWRPNANAPFGWVFVYVTWAGTLLGWAFATLAVAGYTGLVRNADTI